MPGLGAERATRADESTGGLYFGEPVGGTSARGGVGN